MPSVPARLGETDPGPAEWLERRAGAADTVAQRLLAAARAGDADVERLVGLADEVGLEELDQVWRHAEDGSIASGLRILYLLRSWVRMCPHELTTLLAAGRPLAEVPATVAGVGPQPQEDDVCRLVDDLLRGALTRDLGVALHRGAALCRVAAAGRGVQDPGDDVDAWAESLLGARLLGTADQLDRVAHSASSQ